MLWLEARIGQYYNMNTYKKGFALITSALCVFFPLIAHWIEMLFSEEIVTMNFAAMWACHALIYGMTGLLITLRIHLCISRKPWFRGVTAILCLAMCAFCWLYPLSVRAHSVSWIMFASSAVDWLWSLFQSKRRK